MNKKKNIQAQPLKKQLGNKGANVVSPNKQNESKKIKNDIVQESPFDIAWAKFINGYGVWIASAISLILILFVFQDFLFGNLTMLYKDIGSDTITSFYPGALYSAKMMRNFGLNQPTWSFYFGLGQSMYSGRDYLDIYTYLNYIYYSIFNSTDVALFLVLVQFLFFIVVGLLAYGYLRIMAIEKYVAVLVSLVLCLCGIMTLGSGWYSYTYAMLQFLLFLYAFELFFQKNIWILFPFAAYFAGGLSPQLFFFGEFLILYFTVRFFSENGWKPVKFAVQSLKIIAMTFFGMLLSSSSLIYRYRSTVEMPRFYGNTSSYTAKLSNLPMFGLENTQFDYNIPFHHYKTAILRLFSNDIMGVGSDFKGWYNYLEAPIFYCGILTLLLLPQIFSFVNKKMKFLYGSFIGFWVLLILFPYFRHAFHLFVGDYYKVSISMFFPFVLILVSALGFSKIIKGENTINTKLLIATFIALIILLFYPYYPPEYNIINKDVRAGVAGYLIVYAVLLYLLKFKRNLALIQIALLIVVCFELTTFATHTMTQRPVVSKTELSQKIGFNDYTVDAVKKIKEKDPNFFRLEKEYQSGVAIHSSLNDGQAQDYFSTACYSSANQINYIRFLEETHVTGRGNEMQSRWAPGVKNRPLLMTLTNIKYLLTRSDSSQSVRFGYKKADKIGDVNIMKNEFYLPLGFTYDTYIAKADFDKLSNFQCDLSLLRSCVVDSADLNSDLTKDLKVIHAKDSLAGLTFPLYRQLVDSLKSDTLNVTSFRMDKISGTLNLKKKKILYISTSFDRSWTAMVDGKPTKVYRVNLGLLGIPVESGKHEIVLSYQPQFAKQGLLIQALIYLIYAGSIAWFVIGRLKARKLNAQKLI